MRPVILILIYAFILTPNLAAAVNNNDAPVIQCTLTGGEKCLEGKCTPIGSMKKIKLPLKVGIERAAGVIAATDVDGWPMVSRIASITHEPGQLVLQGVGFGIGWTMTVEATGPRATATLSAADGVSVLFGTCQAEPE
ncbi:hypothetical protein [Geminicoccus flavidas]|uniref:hypothetical protein n=1 Tax=Geminicoccus flavidas TaxID=2506407 RepID=UPI00135920B7|nr:hypothetical protein [Geminicoccus flavidas]